MDGVVIKVGNEYVNWQGMLVDQICWAQVFADSSEAQLVASTWENFELVPHKLSVSSSSLMGSYHEWHK